MKKLITLAICLFAIASFAQENKSKSQKAAIHVSGNCEHCQKRIVTTALSQKGVKYATWNRSSKQLSLIFDARKIDLTDIHKAISEAGHDTKLFQASNQVYEDLPECCKYDRLSEEE